MKNQEDKKFRKDLKGGHILVIEDKLEGDEITLSNGKGTTLFTFTLSEDSTTLKVSAENIHFSAEKSIKITADDIEIESSKDTKISCQGDLKSYTKGDTMMLSEGEKLDIAKIQTIKSDLGNVDIVANDDVTLKGERVKLN